MAHQPRRNRAADHIADTEIVKECSEPGGERDGIGGRHSSPGSRPYRPYFYTPEDLVVRKLLWFRSGGEVSERQWRDVLGILKISGPTLDVEYLRSAAAEVDVGDLLELARAQSLPEP